MKTNGQIRNFCYSKKDPSDDDRRGVIASFAAPLERINEHLKNSKYHVGDSVTGADLYLYETFRMMEVLHKEEAHKYQHIARVASSIEELDWFKAYKGSSRWYS